jgi:hypothetical protein
MYSGVVWGLEPLEAALLVRRNDLRGGRQLVLLLLAFLSQSAAVGCIRSCDCR